MSECVLRLLLVEDNPDQAVLVRRQLERVPRHQILLHEVSRLDDALNYVADHAVDAVLLDLSLPDSEMTDTLPTFVSQAPQIPIIVLTSFEDLNLSRKSLLQGAQDYVVKSQAEGESLVRAVRHAIERKHYVEGLERSQRELKHFAHVVSHELKQPLCVLQMCCGLLEARFRDKLTEETREIVGNCMDSARCMNALITNLLQYAVSGGTPVEQTRCAFDDVLAKSLATLHNLLQEQGAVVTHDPLPQINADAVQVGRVFQHLVENAIRFRGSEPPRVHVSAERRGGDWLFGVRDNGAGFNPAEASQLFELFKRGATSSETAGIGLAICKRVIENHGGRIWAETHPGRGSTFWFTIPAKYGEASSRSFDGAERLAPDHAMTEALPK